MAKVLVSHHRPFLPIIRRLLDQGHQIIALQPQLAQELRNLDLECKALIEFNTPDIQRASARESAALIGRIVSLNGELPTISLSPPLPDFVHNGDLVGLLYSKVGDLSLLIHCLDGANPDVALVHNDVEPLTRAVALWCKQNETPCLHIPHAIYQNVENRHDIHSIITASHLASSGPYQTAWYTRRGFKAENILETGLPQFDDWATKHFDQKRGRQLLGLDLNYPIITYASSWAQNTNLTGMHDGVNETYEAILECSKKMTDAHFIIKAHPRDRQANWHIDKAKEMGAKVTVVAQHLDIVLMASDAILAYGPSNILLEACHVPWLRLACTSGYEQDNVITKINTDTPNIDKMIEQLYALLKQQPADTRKFKRKYLGACDGNNTSRIVEFINDLCQNSKTSKSRQSESEPIPRLTS